MGTLTPLLHQFDTENDVKSALSKYRKPTATSYVCIINDLMTSKAFSVQIGRKMNYFKKGKYLLQVQQDLIE